MPLSDRLSILIPTRNPNRPLARCLESIFRQPLHPRDEVLVIGDTLDGPLPEVEATVAQFGPQFRYVAYAGEKHDYGHSQVNYGMAQAKGDWLAFNDDDDVFTVGAFDAIRIAITELSEPLPMLFRFIAHYGFCFWDEPVLREGHIGGHCAVFPNIPDRLGKWAPHYEGDFSFLKSTLDLWPENSAVWRTDIIAVARPEQQSW